MAVGCNGNSHRKDPGAEQGPSKINMPLAKSWWGSSGTPVGNINPPWRGRNHGSIYFLCYQLKLIGVTNNKYIEKKKGRYIQISVSSLHCWVGVCMFAIAQYWGGNLDVAQARLGAGFRDGQCSVSSSVP